MAPSNRGRKHGSKYVSFKQVPIKWRQLNTCRMTSALEVSVQLCWSVRFHASGDNQYWTTMKYSQIKKGFSLLHFPHLRFWRCHVFNSHVSSYTSGSQPCDHAAMPSSHGSWVRIWVGKSDPCPTSVMTLHEMNALISTYLFSNWIAFTCTGAVVRMNTSGISGHLIPKTVQQCQM